MYGCVFDWWLVQEQPDKIEDGVKEKNEGKADVPERAKKYEVKNDKAGKEGNLKWFDQPIPLDQE